MRENNVIPELPVNRSPSADHRRQMLWQVWVPLIAAIIVTLALGILAIVGAVQGSSQVERWGNISAVLVILPMLVVGIVLLAIVGGSAFGVTKLLQKMPSWMLTVQLFMIRLSLMFRRAADSATKPVVATNTFAARVSTVWNRIFRRKAAHS